MEPTADFIIAEKSANADNIIAKYIVALAEHINAIPWLSRCASQNTQSLLELSMSARLE